MRFCTPLRYGKDKQILRICKTAWAGAATRAARPLRGLGWRCRPSPMATPRSGPDEHRKPTWARTCKAPAKGARGCRASAVQTPAAGWTGRASGAWVRVANCRNTPLPRRQEGRGTWTAAVRSALPFTWRCQFCQWPAKDVVM